MITGNYIYIIILIHDYKCGHICINRTVTIKRACYSFILRIVFININWPQLILNQLTNPKNENQIDLKNQMPVKIKN